MKAVQVATSDISLAVFLTVFSLVPITTSNECSNLMGILMRYGMTRLLKGQYHYAITERMKLGAWDLQDTKIYNLSSMRISPDVKLSDFVQTENGITPCFRVLFSLGFQELLAEGMSRFRILGRRPKFTPVSLSILPFEVEIALRVCSPFELSKANIAIDLVPVAVNVTEPIKLAQLQLELEGLRFLQWTGVRLKGEGLLNWIAGTAVRIQVVNKAIKRQLEKRLSEIMLEKLAVFTNRMYQRVERWVDKARQKYFSKLT
ncbi:hypothetical protein AAHC03_026778 [Spirometra sp. Aus1]